jgi:hypothetical protein
MLVRMQTAAALVQTWVLAELVRMQPKGGRCDGANANEKDKISLLFLFGETVYTDERNKPVR